MELALICADFCAIFFAEFIFFAAARLQILSVLLPTNQLQVCITIPPDDTTGRHKYFAKWFGYYAMISIQSFKNFSS